MCENRFYKFLKRVKQFFTPSFSPVSLKCDNQEIKALSTEISFKKVPFAVLFALFAKLKQESILFYTNICDMQADVWRFRVKINMYYIFLFLFIQVILLWFGPKLHIPGFIINMNIFWIVDVFRCNVSIAKILNGRKLCYSKITLNWSCKKHKN